MISPITSIYGKSINFRSKSNDKESDVEKEDTLLEGGPILRSRIAMEKLVKGVMIYPLRGLSGSKNSNFYEFLTMGTVPYLIGSGMLMSIFNSVNPSFLPFDYKRAAKLGNKMALGVAFYALFKEASKMLVNYPVKWKTGVDTELRFKKVNYLLQETPTSDRTTFEYHKVGESVDFPRWDLLYGKVEKNEPLNFRYDKIAKKVGLGENLNDSDQEVKPIYKEILVKSKLAKSISSYLWAAVGVGIAFQKPFENYFNVATLKFWQPEKFAHSLKVFGRSFVDATKDFIKGSTATNVSPLVKHSGKILLGAAALSTVLGVLNVFNITKKPQKHQPNVIDTRKESVEG